MAIGLWRLLKQYGYNSSTYTALNAAPATQAEGTVQPLDGIDPDLPGSANIARIKQFANSYSCEVVNFSLSIITERAAFESLLIQEELDRLRAKQRVRFTNRKYSDHWRDLRIAGLMRDLDTNLVLFFSTYFAVPKNEEVARAIFNGKELSSLFRPPGSVNLLDPPSLIRKVQEWYTAAKGEVFVVNGDIRHWFHLIPLHPEIQRYFGLHMGDVDGTSSVWTSLPMGWSWSPFVSQALAYSLLAYRRCEPAAADAKQPATPCPHHWNPIDLSGLTNDKLPQFLPIHDREGKEVGFACVYYDNYFALSTSEEVAEHIAEMIPANAEHLDITIK